MAENVENECCDYDQSLGKTLSSKGVESRCSCDSFRGHDHEYVHPSNERESHSELSHRSNDVHDNSHVHVSKVKGPCSGKFHGHIHESPSIEASRDGHDHHHSHASCIKTPQANDSCCSGEGQRQENVMTNDTGYYDHNHGHVHISDTRDLGCDRYEKDSSYSKEADLNDSKCCSDNSCHDKASNYKEGTTNNSNCCGDDDSRSKKADFNDSDCCGDKSCYDKASNCMEGTTNNSNCCDNDDHCKDNSQMNLTERSCNKTITSEEGHAIELVVQEIKDICDFICNACDPNSTIPHTLQTSRFRVANLCCSGEEKIIRTCLETLTGIENVAVNVIGRYVVVKHCAMKCCAPSEKIVDELNSKHLGASIQEVGDNDNDEKEKLDYVRISHVTIVFSLFLLGLIFQFIGGGNSDIAVGLYLTSAALGLLPILYSSYITILRKTIDIHILMVIAVAGAIGGKEYFDASLVVTLFILAELIESIAMMKVRQAVNSGSTSMAKEAYLSNGQKIKVEDLKIGNVLAVRAGEMILGTCTSYHFFLVSMISWNG